MRLNSKGFIGRSRLALAALIVAPTLALLMSQSARHSIAFAQSVTGAPGAPQAPTVLNQSQGAGATTIPLASLPPAPIVPAVPVPGAPAAISSTTALPQLAPAPRVVASAPPSQPQTFRCSCFGTGTGTRWIGKVVATSFTSADQAAEGQCVNNLLKSNEPSPYLGLGSGGFNTRSPYPAVNPNTAPGNVVSGTGTTAQTEISGASSGSLTVATYCTRCACN